MISEEEKKWREMDAWVHEKIMGEEVEWHHAEYDPECGGKHFADRGPTYLGGDGKEVKSRYYAGEEPFPVTEHELMYGDSPIPRYHKNLDRCREVETKLTEMRIYTEYLVQLCQVVLGPTTCNVGYKLDSDDFGELVNATPEQKVLAFRRLEKTIDEET